MWHFRRLRGLPGDGELPVQFSESGSGMYREGVVFEFASETGGTWVGNFQPGQSNAESFARIILDGRAILVVAGGQGYVINPDSREVVNYLGSSLASVEEIPDNPDVLVLNHHEICFEAIGPKGSLWRTRRLSWDGFQNVRYSREKITGEGWNAIEGTWEHFQVDMATGIAMGGGFDA